MTAPSNSGVETVAAKQVLDIRILNCGGLRDLMSELEASFLMNALGLFRNSQDFGRGKPRANVNLARAYDADGFYRAAFSDADVLHLIAHASGQELDVGVAKTRVRADTLAGAARSANPTLPPIVVSTGCKLMSQAWRDGIKGAGAQVLIASEGDVTPAALTSFDMAFYSALLARVRKTKSLSERVEASFELADRHYRAIHAKGTKFARFSLAKL